MSSSANTPPSIAYSVRPSSDQATVGTEAGFPFAFFAVVAIAVIGLYIAYVTPVYLRWRAGSSFEPGSWNLGEKYRWMNVVPVVWVAISVVVFLLPFAPTGLPWNDDFDATTLNYAPAIVVVFLVLVIW